MNALRVRGAVVTLALAMTFAAPVLAQSSRSFPLLPRGTDAQTGLPVLGPVAADLAPLAQESRVALTGVALPGGRVVTLDLKRVNLDRLGFGFQVNGQPAPGLLDGLDLSVWVGGVAGEGGSAAVVSLP